MGLTDDRRQRAEEILELAMDLPPRERRACLDRECGDDRELRRRAVRGTPITKYCDANRLTIRDRFPGW